VDGIGPVLAGRILGRTRRPSRNGSQFAAYTGTAPIEVSSAERTRHRLSRAGDRQLNAALHLAAVTQVRMRRSAGRAYYDRKIAQGKTHNEALRCLKRQLAEHVWRTMIKDENRRQHRPEQTTGPGGHTGAALQSSATGPTPTASSSDKSLPGPADNQPTTTGNPTA
jgi:transposase